MSQTTYFAFYTDICMHTLIVIYDKYEDLSKEHFYINLI